MRLNKSMRIAKTTLYQCGNRQDACMSRGATKKQIAYEIYRTLPIDDRPPAPASQLSGAQPRGSRTRAPPKPTVRILHLTHGAIRRAGSRSAGVWAGQMRLTQNGRTAD